MLSRHSNMDLAISVGVVRMSTHTLSTGLVLGAERQPLVPGGHPGACEEMGVLGTPRDRLGSDWARLFSPEQQCVPLGPHGQVHKAVPGEVLTPAQRLPEVLEPGGELGARDPLARDGQASLGEKNELETSSRRNGEEEGERQKGRGATRWHHERPAKEVGGPG